MEINAIQQLIQLAYRDIQSLDQQMDAAKINSAIFKIDEQYNSVKDTVSEYKKQLKLQPQILSFKGEQKLIQGSNSGNSKSFRLINPVHTELMDKMLAYEIQLKTLLLKKSRLEKQKSRGLKSNGSTQSQIADRPEFKQKRDQIKYLENKIKP